LFSVSYYIKAGGYLVMNRSDHRIFDHFFNIGSAEFVKIM